MPLYYCSTNRGRTCRKPQLVPLQGQPPYYVSHGGLVVSKHGMYVGSPGSIPTAITMRTAAGGDAEHVSLNH